MNSVNESLLEMFYFAPTVEAFKKVFSDQEINIFKPTQNQEGWLGYDQAFVRMDYSNEEFSRMIKDGSYKDNPLEKFYFGFFMQYKKMERVNRIIRNTSISIPTNFTETPYYRIELSTKKQGDNLSQHEILKSLHNNIRNAFVYYVGPMLFELNSAFTEPNLDDLRIIDINSAPQLSEWNLNQRHFIMFENETCLSPYWCSKPQKGKAIKFKEWLSSIKRLNGDEVLELIDETEQYIMSTKQMNDITLPSSFTIVQVQNKFS